jgi:hypothetical protein
MCAGGSIARRFNAAFGTEFAHDVPVDALAAVHYTMNWAKELHNLLGVYGMRHRVNELVAATKRPQPLLVYPGSAELPNPEYTVEEQLGMHVQYLAALGDPDVRPLIQRLWHESGSAAVRMGCAKAAMEIGDRELFHSIVSGEPQGRNQHFMSKLVRRRKKRDLVDAVPRLFDDQYELAGPLWTTKGRVDPNTVEGRLDVSREK